VIGLPSLRALDGAPGPRIWLASEATDMRCGVRHEVDSTIVRHGGFHEMNLRFRPQ